MTFVFRSFDPNISLFGSNRCQYKFELCNCVSIYSFVFYPKVHFENNIVTLHNFISYFVCRSMCLSVRQLRARVKDKHWECHLTWLSNNMFLLPSKSMIIILIFLSDIYILWDRVGSITQLLILQFSWCSKKKSSNWLTHRSSFILI